MSRALGLPRLKPRSWRLRWPSTWRPSTWHPKAWLSRAWPSWVWPSWARPSWSWPSKSRAPKPLIPSLWRRTWRPGALGARAWWPGRALANWRQALVIPDLTLRGPAAPEAPVLEPGLPDPTPPDSPLPDSLPPVPAAPVRSARPGRRAAAVARARPRSLNLALQGGGAHGAFTWGVLDRLLEDGQVAIGSVSGASAGAMNAVVLAYGLMDGGAPYAREHLGEFWRAVSELSRYSLLRAHPFNSRAGRDGQVSPTRMLAFDLMTRLVSPYQFNPLDFNPLREVLEHSIDFKRLRRDCQIDLHIAATDIATGKPRIFRNQELTVDCLLASACLPQLHRAVKIGRRHYWDGGFSANPPLLPLVEAGAAEDTLIVQLDAAVTAQVPTDARAIIARVNHLTFGGPLKREVETIERLRALAAEGGILGGAVGRALDRALGGAQRRRILRHRFHHIAAGAPTRKLGAGSRLNPDWALLCRLRDMGRAAADTWMRQNAAALGRRSTVDLTAKFL